MAYIALFFVILIFLAFAYVIRQVMLASDVEFDLRHPGWEFTGGKTIRQIEQEAKLKASV